MLEGHTDSPQLNNTPQLLAEYIQYKCTSTIVGRTCTCFDLVLEGHTDTPQLNNTQQFLAVHFPYYIYLCILYSLFSICVFVFSDMTPQNIIVDIPVLSYYPKDSMCIVQGPVWSRNIQHIYIFWFSCTSTGSSIFFNFFLRGEGGVVPKSGIVSNILGMLGGQSTRPQNYGTLLLLKIVHACKMGANNVHPQSRQVSWHGACPVCLAGVLLTRIGEHRRSSWQENSPGSQELG